MPEAPSVELIVCYVTCPCLELAERLGRLCVKERLAACANILPGMRSIYRWKEGVETADETVLLFKTRAELLEALAARIRELHPYELPCVMALPIAGGDAAYLAWIEAESGIM